MCEIEMCEIVFLLQRMSVSVRSRGNKMNDWEPKISRERKKERKKEGKRDVVAEGNKSIGPLNRIYIQKFQA